MSRDSEEEGSCDHEEGDELAGVHFGGLIGLVFESSRCV